MSPDQISVLTAIVALFDKASGWPIWFLFLLAMIGPWVVMLILDRNHERRHAAQRKMYENNVVLLEQTQSIAKDLKEIVIMNTQTSQKLTDSVEKNQFCPMVRLEKRAGGMQS
ncbi:conserved hypothetical protein [uncultured Desulfobacterium sp.]|uniref:Uncharacterized protein n=1 Tax=uncultured Desulfobacterium sp. TaxID=201089 RepID=A0A445MWT0_9BACT|nr:conserved hypothetical protein [uncultured Desulfobacterium sp.]